jgi:hypothetical protein
MVPTQESLASDDATIRQGQNGLIGEVKLPPLQRIPQVQFQRTPLACLSIMPRLKELKCSTPRAFGTVEANVGVPKERTGVITVRRRDRNADAHGAWDFHTVDQKGLLERRQNAMRQRRRAARVVNTGCHKTKLVSAEPRKGIAGAGAAT